jgi:hypothetical protein
MIIHARHIFVITAFIVNIIICFCGIGVAETKGLGWQKRYPDKPYFIPTQDLKTPNQGENNVETYYFKTYQESPFVLGGDGHGDRAWTIKDGKTSPVNILELNYGFQKKPYRDYRTMETIGTYTVTHPLTDLPMFMIRPVHYVVGRNQDGSPQLGMRPIPVDDKNDKGSQVMDSFLRKKMNLAVDDYIFAPIFFYHAEQYIGSLLELSKTETYRIVDGVTHMGAYIGQGRTRNSPKNYHHRQWEVVDEKNIGYPAQVAQVHYDGVPAAEFNKNAYIALRLLNEGNQGVQEPRLKFEQDYYNATNLKEILDFYRAWLDPTWIRSAEDNNIPYYKMIKHWFKHDLYCSEHITMVLNVALNLVQTESGYIATFGSDSEQPNLGAAKQFKDINKGGEWFWKRAQIVWKQLTDEPFPQVDDTVMIPLWSRPGHLHTVNKIVGRRKLVAGMPIKPGEAPLVTYPGVSMAWTPMTLVEIVADFMEIYARWDMIGPELSIKVLNGFEGEVSNRLEWPIKNACRNYQRVIEPFVELINKYSTLSKEQNIPPAEAYDNKFRLDAAVEIEKLRNCSDFNIGSETFWLYSPPSVINRIIQGLHRRNRYVSFEIIATAFQREHLQETVSTASPF